MIIIVVSFYDIFTVLNRYGPLNLIKQVLEERDTNILAGMSYPLGGDDVDDSDEHFETAEEQLNKRGSELGLGDFSMFSLFLAIVSLEGNWFLTFICYVAIMIGMFITDLVMMAYNYRAFPALPFPIFFTMSTYYLSKAFVAFSPFDLFSFCFNIILY
uniref:Presenilin n=1 Tax=Panagrolaimus sp. PS1159 TaxID=55785 RepID=A0AC35F0Z6_9BILA